MVVLTVNHYFDENLMKAREDVSKLSEIYSTCSHGRVTWIIEILLKAVGLKLCKNNEDPSLKNILKPCDLVSSLWGPSNLNIWSRVFNILKLLLVAYLLIKAIIIIILQYQRDCLIDELKPSIQLDSNANRTKDCAPRESVLFSELDLINLEKLNSITAWIDFIGNPFVSLVGATVMARSVAIITTIILPLWGINYVRKNTPRTDHLNFIRDPLSELARIDREVSKIIDDLIRDLNHHGTIVDRLHQPVENSRPRKLSIKRPSDWHSKQSDETQYCEMSCYYVTLLMDIRRLGLVRPANLSYNWYKSTIRSHLCILLPVCVIVLTAFQLSIILSTFSALYKRTDYRLKVIECEKLIPNGVLIEGNLHLAPIESAQDRQAFLEYDGTTRSHVWLAAAVESRYLFTPSVLLSQLEAQVVYATFPAIFAITYAYLHAFGSLYGLTWLDQLDKQVRHCIRLIDSQVEREERKCSLREEGNNQLSTHLLITYLNFELYRRQRKTQYPFNRFMITQAAVYTGLLFAIFQYSVYYGGKFFRNANEIIAFMTVQLVIFMNGSLINEALITAKIIKLAGNLMQLLGNSSNGPIKKSYAIALWRRQMSFESWKIITPNIFGSPISLSKLLSYNGYFAALYLLLYKHRF